MLDLDRLDRVLIIAPHADDELIGCGGLMSRLTASSAEVRVLYMAVDGFHHYGIDGETTYQQRIAEIDLVKSEFGFTYTIAYGDKDLIEQLDTLPKRDLVDRFEHAFDGFRPQLLLLPSGKDYDQDHVATFETAFAAARPMPQSIGKWLIPHVFVYEMSKLMWSVDAISRPVAYLDISADLERKLQGISLYRSQLRDSPHIRSLESVTALASLRGKEIGVEHAEAYGVLRTVLT